MTPEISSWSGVLGFHENLPASRRLPSGDLYEFPFYREPEFIVCVRRVRVELGLKHGLVVLVDTI